MDQLHQSYSATEYRVPGAEPAVDPRFDQPCPSLDRLLEQRGISRWDSITVWNPMSNRLPLPRNRERAFRLVLDLADLGIPDVAGWTSEESLLVLGIKENTAVEFARRYCQRAIVAGELGGVPRLVECA